MYFYYKIDYYFDVEAKTKPLEGIVTGKNFKKAVEKLEKMYGNEIEEIFCLKPLTDASTLEFPQHLSKEVSEAIKNISDF